MKTCLYQPIFINPQAYFVFPSLYHIEKGDSFIEPANVTGQLIINTLTDDPTLTPIILTVKDNNQVDFSIFAGKHIRISQYTDEGAVVLGEWLMPGESTPVYPDWFTSSVKAIYDPKKQGMTNFDVIEAYIQDFTVWKKYDGKIIVSNNKAIVKANTPFSGNWIISNNKKFEIGKIKVTGLDGNIGNNFLSYSYYNKDGNRIIIRIKKDGIYEFPNNEYDAEAGFHCNSSLTFSNDIIIEQLPTSILKDFSGNSNHAYLYGGKGKLNSGMGVYQQDFSKLIISRVDKKQDSFSFTVSGSGGSYLAYMQLGNWNNKAFKILANINAKSDYLYLRFRNSTDAVITSVMLKDGENIIPAQNIEGATKAVFEYSLKEGESITITQIPDYPDQLCYDGKMYAVCYGFPILTDYTVMAERTWFEIGDNSCFASKRIGANKGAFAIEYRKLYAENFGLYSAITFVANKKEIIVQSKEKYNDKDLIAGNEIDTNQLLIGGISLNNNRLNEPYIGCHGTIIVADRSFTEDEITWLKENIYNIEI